MLARGGREREVVNRDDHYSPHFQVGTRPPLAPALPTRACPGHGRGPVGPSISGGQAPGPRGTQPAASFGLFEARDLGGGFWRVADCGIWGPRQLAGNTRLRRPPSMLNPFLARGH